MNVHGEIGCAPVTASFRRADEGQHQPQIRKVDDAVPLPLA